MTTLDSNRKLRWVGNGIIAIRLLGRFLVEMLVSNLAQARLVLGRNIDVRPQWIEFESRLQRPVSRTLLGVMISMTPGTLTCDLDENTLLIHVLNARSGDETIERIRSTFESLLLEIEGC